MSTQHYHPPLLDGKTGLNSLWSSTKIANEIAAAAAGSIVVADQAAADALTGLVAGDSIIVQNGANITPLIIYVRSTPDGTITNAASHTYTVGYNAQGLIGDNQGSSDQLTIIGSNNTLVNLQTNGGITHLVNMVDSSIGNSKRISLVETTKDKLLRRFNVAGSISFSGPNNSIYRFAIRTRTSGGAEQTLTTGQQITTRGLTHPVNVSFSVQRFIDNGMSVYVVVERLSGGGSGNITVQEYMLNVQNTKWQTNQ